MGSANISIRRSIAWHLDPPSEPTSTLVLTSPARHFIDLRILKPDPSSSCPLPNDSSTDFGRLDWAFAGQSEIVEGLRKEDDGAPKHGIWHHWIDSRVPLDEDPPPDEGDLYPYGDDGTDTLEIGSMINPATGILTQYKEVWRDVPVERIGKEKKRFCVVLRLEHPRGEARGCVVRVGRFVQGMVKMREGEEVGLERWRWVEEEEEAADYEEKKAAKADKREGEDEDGGGRWERIVKMGSRGLPCSVTFDAEKVQVGQRVEEEGIGDCAWVVTEVCGW